MNQTVILLVLLVGVGLALVALGWFMTRQRGQTIEQAAAALQIPWQVGEEVALRQRLDSFELIRAERVYPVGSGRSERAGVPFDLAAYNFSDGFDSTNNMLLLVVESRDGCSPFRFDWARPMLDRGTPVEQLGGFPHLAGKYLLDKRSADEMGALLPYLDSLVGEGHRPQMECNGSHLLFADEVPTGQITPDRLQAFIEQGFRAAEALGMPLK